ncbi:MlaD family protein [Candidatus Protofrankia californiensis]|uniref:MlaD family protein n=1 Tax=Candidatus Protofrankia californiensis TaxID=1839754 RepID=UPI0010414D7B|nr:MlaD family protein [Candidatus Protofrankia californiensis]
MNFVQRSIRGARRISLSHRAVGIGVTVAILLFGAAVFQMEKIMAMLSSGDTIRAEFSRGYKLEEYHSEVRIANATVGKVTDVKLTDHGTVLVSMKVDNDVRDILKSAPSAAIRPTTLLGGVYYVSLLPGGANGKFDGNTIPVQRTSVSVELDKVLSAVTPPAQKGVQSSISQLDGTLRQGGKESVRDLLNDAPGVLQPAGEVLGAARGTRPGTDLTELVEGLETTAVVLNRTDGQLSSIFTDMHRATAALAAGSQPLAESMTTMPDTLRTTRTGLGDLRGSLDLLTSTAESLRPTAKSLDSLLQDLDPVLVRARPLVSDTRTLLTDLRPLVQELIPTADKATQVLSNVRGPVLDRINGPIKQMVLSPWQGSGVYQDGGSSNRFYEELGYLGVNGAKVFQTHDQNGTHGRLMAGVGGRTLGGAAVPMSLEQYLESLGINQPPGPRSNSQSGGLLRFLMPPEESR